MYRYYFVFILSWLAANAVFSQDCDCAANFAWTKKTFEENDAGFRYALEQKGEAAYAAHNAAFLKRVKKIRTKVECTQALYEWLTFFRNGHLGIRMLGDGTPSATAGKQKVPPPAVIRIDTNEFRTYLSRKATLDPEGIWEAPPYRIGIRKDGAGYGGFIISTDVAEWKAGQVKLTFSGNEGVFYLRNHSPETFSGVVPLGNSYLRIGRFLLRRTFPEIATEPDVAQFMRLAEAQHPFLEQIDSVTLLFRIPSFGDSFKPAIDSVLSANETLLRSTKNLILDLRNNGGGSDRSFNGLIPLLYTNPIRTVGVAYYSTPLNNRRMLDFIEDPEYGFDEEDKVWARKAYDTLQKHLGTFVNLDPGISEMLELDTVYSYPEKIGILINNGNGSTTEQFLLAAKQSSKVKLFGTTTYGVLDISNMYFVKAPSGDFELGYCLTKSYRIPEMTIDGKGIQPDYYLDSEIPPYDWVNYARRMMSR